MLVSTTTDCEVGALSSGRKEECKVKAICPKNKEHDEFYTTAHVMQEWRVDNEGNFIEVVEDCLQTTYGPNKDNTWLCAICGSVAEVKEE